MNKQLTWSMLTLTLLLQFCVRQEPPLPPAQLVSLKTPTKNDNLALTIDLQPFTLTQVLPTQETITIPHDPVYKKSKTFIGFSLQHYLDSIITVQKFDTTDAIVQFECSDGYNATMPLAQVMQQKNGWIASRDLEAPPGKNWREAMEKKMRPFYLVWQQVDYQDHRYTWPYGLAKIRLLPAGMAFQDAYPTGAPEHAEGFQLFRQTCMKCHSLNKTGGTMAPELNVPKNITEYWTDANIIAFARNPQSFRFNSTMPPITDLSDEEYHRILQYLKYMAQRKIAL